MQSITYELKYCERCGSLGLRRADSANIYCKPCGQALENLSFDNQKQRTDWLLARKRRAQIKVKPALLATAELVPASGRLQ